MQKIRIQIQTRKRLLRARDAVELIISKRFFHLQILPAASGRLAANNHKKKKNVKRVCVQTLK